MDMFKLGRDDLVDQVKDVLTVGDFYAMCSGLGTQIILPDYWKLAIFSCTKDENFN